MVALLALVAMIELAAGLTVLAGTAFLVSWLIVFYAPPGVPIFTPLVQWGTMFMEEVINPTHEPHWIVLGIVMVALLTEFLFGAIRLVITKTLK